MDKELQNFIDNFSQHWNKTHEKLDNQTKAFVLMVKLTEEVGEYAREVARSFGFASRKRLEHPSKLDGEFADVVIYALMLAKTMNINIEEAFKTKMAKIEEKIKNNEYSSEGSMCDEMGCSCKE